MNCHNAYPTTADCENAYAARDTAHRAPAEDRSRLYLLSFLLTADRAKAERCLVEGLDFAAEDNTAFREWANSWARQIIIDNALRLIAPHPDAGSQGADSRRSG
jgi:hypothetical protein